MTSPSPKTALTPKLTKFDQRVLATLDDWTSSRDLREEPLQWRTVWAIAEALREYDCALVRRTLDGLVHLNLADARGWDHRRAYVRNSWRSEIEA